jgi:hypothetical protein
MFESEGMPCRHILFIIKGKGLNEIPGYGIVNRWTKLATSKPFSTVMEMCWRNVLKLNMRVS